MVTPAKTVHKKGKLAPGKVNKNWRILVGISNQLDEEAERLGFDSVPQFLNAHFTRYFNGETIVRDA